MFQTEDALGGLFGGTFDTNNNTSLPVVGSGDMLGWGTLGFGAFRAFRSKRVNTMTLALIVFGMWRLGMISNIIPQNKDGSINWVMIGIAALLPPTAAALIGGAPALIISVLSRMLWRRKGRRWYRRSRMLWGQRFRSSRAYRRYRRWRPYRRRF